MIRNEKQYKITKSWLTRFERGEQKLNELPQSKQQPWLRQAQRGSLKSQIQQLKREIYEYEALKSGKVAIPDINLLTAVPELLIKKRIARGWTQGQLAERLGLHQQQIQRYENTDYATATFEVLQRVLIALNQKPTRSATRNKKHA